MPLTPNVLPRLLPKNVVAVELCDDVTEILYPEEEHFIARAVNKRVREFTTVRACARLALEKLDLRRPVQVPGPRGEPTWPTGIVGAMTHCQGYRAATVARASDFHSLGIDAEPNSPLPPRIRSSVLSPAEMHHASALAEVQPGVAWERLMFSAKESVFKAWYPLAKTWLGFDDGEITFKLDHTFCARLHRSHLPPELQGRSLQGTWDCSHNLLVTALTVETSNYTTSHRQTAVDPNDRTGDISAIGPGEE